MLLRRAALLCCLAATIVLGQRAKYNHYRKDYHIIEHAVDLGTITFDKVISQQNVTVVMFMHFLSHGAKQTEFASFAESTVTQPSVLAATVGVEDDVEMTNWELAIRFGLKSEDLPLVKLFVRGEEAATLQTQLTCDSLRAFVTENTGMWIGRTGTVMYLDKLATKFVRSESDEDKNEIVELARQYKEQTNLENDQGKSAAYYLRIFEEYIKRGPSFLGIELGRLRAEMARHKFHKPNQCGIRKEQNILQTFQQSNIHYPHDEL